MQTSASRGWSGRQLGQQRQCLDCYDSDEVRVTSHHWLNLVSVVIVSVMCCLGKDMDSSCSVQFRSVAQSCPTLCDPMDRSMPGLPVHHQLPEFTQTHVHRVSDAIQPSHPLSSPSPPAPNPSQNQGLLQ